MFLAAAYEEAATKKNRALINQIPTGNELFHQDYLRRSVVMSGCHIDEIYAGRQVRSIEYCLISAGRHHAIDECGHQTTGNIITAKCTLTDSTKSYSIEVVGLKGFG